MGETANPVETAAAKAAAPTRKPRPVVVTLDHTRDYSTCHGERAPNDPAYGIAYFQNGLPFDGEGKLMADHPSVAGNPKAQAMVEKLVKRAEKIAERRAQIADDEEPEPDDELDRADDGDGPIDLKLWAMGRKQYRWQLVSDAIVLKFQRRITNKRDALEALIGEGIVQPGQLSQQHKNALATL